MVMPLVDEHRPKCYLCHRGFEAIEELREHQLSMHKDYFESKKTELKKEPAPGDVTVF